jgi:hypothetical protein
VKKMPEGKEQATEADLKAPEGKYRIIQVNEADGMSIVGDIYDYDLAITIATLLSNSEEYEGCEFVVWDDKGQEIFYL